MATLALRYLSRTKEAKEAIGQAGGIPLCLEMLTQENLTEESKTVALSLLWAEVCDYICNIVVPVLDYIPTQSLLSGPRFTTTAIRPS